MRVRSLVMIAAAALVLGGCATPIIGTLTLSQLSTIAGVASTVTTGKGLSDHLLSFLTGKDCSIVEGLLRSDRDICEPRGSLATKEDFKGVFAYFERKNHEGEPGDNALERYAAARGDELANATGAEDQEADQVVEANATSLDLLRLSFWDDLKFLDSGNNDIAASPVSEPAPTGTASASSNVVLLTYRDTDRDGTPRILSRYVVMMDPIPDSQVNARADATSATTLASDAASVAPAPTKPVIAPTPVAVAQVSISDSAHVVPAKPEQKQQPVQSVHWYLSGR